MAQKSAQRHFQLKVRLNDKERAVFEEAAQIAGLTLSAWVRMVLRERVAEKIMAAGKASSAGLTLDSSRGGNAKKLS